MSLLIRVFSVALRLAGDDGRPLAHYSRQGYRRCYPNAQYGFGRGRDNRSCGMCGSHGGVDGRLEVCGESALLDSRQEMEVFCCSQNRKLRPVIDDGEGDVALWNKEIAKYFQGELLVPVSRLESC